MHKVCAHGECMIDQFARQIGVAEEDIVRYKRHCPTHSYEPGDTIFKQKSSPSGIYCIQAGYILLWHTDELGNQIGLRIAMPDEIIGHRSYFGEEPHAATAVALTKCTVCQFPRTVINDLQSRHPGFYSLFLRVLAQDRGPPDGLLLRNPYLPVKLRIINMLLILKRVSGQEDSKGHVHIHMPFYRRDLARLISVRPETVARAIQELNRSGLVVFKGRNVTIADMEKLRDSIKFQALKPVE